MSPKSYEKVKFLDEKLEQLTRTLIADHALLDSTLFLKGPFQNTAQRLERAQSRLENSRQALWVGFQVLLEDHKKTTGKQDFLDSDDSGRNFLKLQYAKAICQTMEGRTFFISEKGYMGIGPDDIKSGDVVVILFGVRTPFILRPNPLQDGLYQVIGDCYVDGFMSGEALQVPGLKSRDFLIW
jgi:hypothetical protein